MYRKYLIKGIALAFAFSLIVFNSGCSSGIGEPKLDESNSKISSSDTRTQSTSQLRSFSDYDLSTIDPVALEYVDNAKTILYATDAFMERPAALEKLDLKSYKNFDDTKDSSEINPMSLRLQLLDIVDEETGKNVNFYDLPKDQKEVFVDKLLQEDAVNISEKLALIPEAKDLIATENNVTTRLLAENNIPVMRVGDLSYLEPKNFNALDDTPGLDPRKKIIKINSHSQSQKAERKTVNQKIFFEKMRKGIENELNAQEKKTANNLRAVDVSFNYPKIDVDSVVKPAWIKSARRGDFVLAIPKHSEPWVFLNVGGNVRFKVGHAGIINAKITERTDVDYENVTIEAYSEDGVQRRTMDKWDTPHYVMGVQEIKYKWKWRGFRSGLYREKIPVSNPERLADLANQYVGCKYVEWYEFPIAKWVAPCHFTCTTLVWWCAKKAYGINVSSWYALLVSPSGLFTDDETYVRHNVMNVR